MARKKTTKKRPREISRSDDDQNDQNNAPNSNSSNNLQLLNNIERNSINSVNVDDAPASSIDDTMRNFDRDVSVDVTRLSRNLTRVLDKHNLCAIYDSRTKKAIASKPRANKKEAKYKVLSPLIPISKKPFP